MLTTVPLKEVLLDSAREVFETMVFIALEEADASAPDLSDPALMGTITFKGAVEGCLAVCCGESCARTVAAGMLGMGSSEELSGSDVSDALGEIANMVLGAVKSRLPQEVASIEVSIPSVVQGRDLRMGPQPRHVAGGNAGSGSEGSRQVRVRVSIEEEHTAELSLLYREGGR